MLFTELSLDDRLQRALATAGFITPTPIQAAALPVALAGHDLVGTAQTGTGKTAAFVLPILNALISTPLADRKTRAVILAPTRELVEQILAVVRELGTHTNIRSAAVYGGVALQQQTRALRNGVEIVVACPGRLLDHINRRNADLRWLDYLVLDEADRMFDMGFLPSIQEIINAVPHKRQTMLFSATFPKSLTTFVKQTLCDPVRVEVDNAVPARTVRHSLYQVKGGMKLPMLTALLRQLIPESDSVLIFTHTRATANAVAAHLYAEGLHADVLTADKTQHERQQTLDRFREGMFPYLVATDIAARGIDVTSISHVINFDIPRRADDYLHRIGRTGRMERAGHAISLMTRGDIRAVAEIEQMLGKNVKVAQLEGSEHQELSDFIPASPHDTVRAKKPARIPRRSVKTTHRPTEDKPRHAAHSAAPAESKPRPDRTPRADATPRNERPRRPGKADAPRADAPPRNERPRRPVKADAAAPAPARTERPTRPSTRRDAPPSRGERPRQQRVADALPTREERRRKQFGSERPAEQSSRPERQERQHRHVTVTSSPKRRERAADNRFGDATPAKPSRQERPGGRKFAGMAAAARDHRRHVAEKRQPGEVPSSPRPNAKSGAAPKTRKTDRGR